MLLKKKKCSVIKDIGNSIPYLSTKPRVSMSGENIRDLNVKGNKPPIAMPLSNHEAQRYTLKKT